MIAFTMVITSTLSINNYAKQTNRQTQRRATYKIIHSVMYQCHWGRVLFLGEGGGVDDGEGARCTRRPRPLPRPLLRPLPRPEANESAGTSCRPDAPATATAGVSTPGVPPTGRGQRTSFHSSLTKGRICRCRYCCRLRSSPGGVTAGGSEVGRAASGLNRVNSCSTPSVVAFAMTIPGRAASNL